MNSLSFVSKGDITRLKQGEEEKRKRYTALCVTAKPVSKEILDRLESLGEVRWLILLIFFKSLYTPSRSRSSRKRQYVFCIGGQMPSERRFKLCLICFSPEKSKNVFNFALTKYVSGGS